MDQIAQFRQIGVPDSRQTNSEVKLVLRRAQQRTETLLNRPRLPPASSLLTTLSTLQRLTQQAYASLPLRRLSLLTEQLEDLHENVERHSILGASPNGDSSSALRRFHRDLTRILSQIQAPVSTKKEKPDKEAQHKIKQFLEKAAERGWKVRDDVTDEPADEVDGFAQSLSYVQKIASSKEELLDRDSDMGVVTDAPLLLLPDQIIPHSVLLSWTQPPLSADVYVIFGRYIVINQCIFMGVTPSLALTEPDDLVPNPRRLQLVANYLDDQGSVDRRNLIQHPKRIGSHYYCPVLSVPSGHHKYFRSWDMILK